MRDTKTILITGANRGIGKEIARQMAELGWRVVVGARDYRKAEETAKEIGGNCIPVLLDVADSGSVREAAEELGGKLSHIDVLVNNAGIIGNHSMMSFDLEEIGSVVNTNFMGAIRVAKYIMPLLQKSMNARIINVSSGMGELASLRSGGYAAYRLSKTALNAFTILLASESTETKVFAMCPGWVRTDMGGRGASRSVGKGAETAVWLATSSEPVSGKFYRDKKVIPW